MPSSPEPQSVVRTFLAAGKLPLSRSISRIESMLQSGDYDAGDLAEQMRTDPTLTAKVMAVANSAYFSRQPCETINDAVNRLGSMQLARIFAQVLAHATLPLPLGAYGLPADGLWRRAVTTAVAAELAAARQHTDGSVCYLVGLLHQIGMLVIHYLWTGAGDYRPLVRTDCSREYTCDEIHRFGHTQADFGAELLRQLAFPEPICRLIRCQYEPSRHQEAHALYVGRLVRALHCDGIAPAVDWSVLAHFDLASDSHWEGFLADVQAETSRRILLGT